MDTQIIETYIAELIDTIKKLDVKKLKQITEVIRRARSEGKTIFIFGNGGSAATASHMVCDFGKNTRREKEPRIKVLALNDNMPTFSAYANDEGYEVVFAEQLKTLGEAGDIVIAISGSGNSPNILAGVKTASEMGMMTVGLTGMGGGKLKDLVDLVLVVESQNIAQVEDAHMIIDHILTTVLR
jgi:D-sedoheptulose 7-phosphate isomerase